MDQQQMTNSSISRTCVN